MTTQAISVTLIGSGITSAEKNGEGVGMTATCTDDGFTELKDAVGTLSLHQAAKGKTFHSFFGRYAAGGAMFRIRNTVSNEIRALEFLALKGTTQIAFSSGPVTIQENDILEAFAEAVPT